MKGPTPKKASLRQMRNKPSTAATLTVEGARKRAPLLPKTREWNKLTRSWWRDVWRSPMAEEFLESDVHGLYILAELVDSFWNDTSDLKLASEIRLQRQCFGLTPIDRRRLQWEVERLERKERKPPARLESGADPRSLFKVVK